MTWEPKYIDCGRTKIEGKSVKVFSNEADYLTLYHIEPVAYANWRAHKLMVTLSSGITYCYENSKQYNAMFC